MTLRVLKHYRILVPEQIKRGVRRPDELLLRDSPRPPWAAEVLVASTQSHLRNDLENHPQRVAGKHWRRLAASTRISRAGHEYMGYGCRART